MSYHRNMKAITTNEMFIMVRVYRSLLLSNKCFMTNFAQLPMFTIAHRAVYG